MSKVADYIDFLEMSYDDVITFLLDKYGPAEDDYFREKSYEKYLAGEVKSIAKGKTSRTTEGLYCHHIEESKYQNMSKPEFIKAQNIPFRAQKKDRLVYCDLVEHALLHALITKEARAKDTLVGTQGLHSFLIPYIMDWYIKELVPTSTWELSCYEKAFLEPDDASTLIEVIFDFLD